MYSVVGGRRRCAGAFVLLVTLAACGDSTGSADSGGANTSEPSNASNDSLTDDETSGITSSSTGSSTGDGGGAGNETGGSDETGGNGAPTPYDRPWSAVAVQACPADSALTQHDEVIDLGGGRPTLVTAWMRSAVQTTNALRIAELVRWADRSTCSLSPISSNCTGLISQGHVSSTHAGWGFRDFVLVTEKLLIWFDFSSAHPLNASYDTLPNGGGGMIRGVWPLTVDGVGLLNFADVRNTENWAPNMFMPGATGSATVQGGGLSSFITEFAADNGITYNVENDANAVLTIHAPLATIEQGTGVLHEQAFLAQSVGHFVDTRPKPDRYLVGSGATAGHISATTTYRVGACDDNVFVEGFWKNEAPHRIGPVVNALFATNTWGETNHGMRDGNLVDFADTSQETCVVRRRHADTQGCHSERADYMEFPGKPQEYRSKANLWVPPPTMILRGRNASGGATPWTMRSYPLSGIVTVGLIFDLHSHCPSSNCSLISAFDITVFNTEFWESEDRRALVPDYDALPEGIEREAETYFLAPAAELHTRMALRFAF